MGFFSDFVCSAGRPLVGWDLEIFFFYSAKEFFGLSFFTLIRFSLDCTEIMGLTTHISLHKSRLLLSWPFAISNSRHLCVVYERYRAARWDRAETNGAPLYIAYYQLTQLEAVHRILFFISFRVCMNCCCFSFRSCPSWNTGDFPSTMLSTLFSFFFFFFFDVEKRQLEFWLWAATLGNIYVKEFDWIPFIFLFFPLPNLGHLYGMKMKENPAT